MKSVSRFWGTIGLIGLLLAPARALTVNELNGLLEENVHLTLVDVRDASFYQRGHIPNAIHIPARVVALKNLPPLGRVVVYGNGLGVEDLGTVLAEFNAKPGIQAEILEGGYSSWEVSKGTTTQSVGLYDEVLNVISFQGLETLHGDDVVLVDLRTPTRLSRQGIDVAEEKSVSLTETFPGKPVVKSPFDVAGVPGSGKLARQSDKPLPLMVLIDDGDGTSQAMARVLRANGVQRVVVLAGGERILERDGVTGLQRMGMGMSEEGTGDANE